MRTNLWSTRLEIALGLEATMFVMDVTTGCLANSTGLVAGGLDMFADASADE